MALDRAAAEAALRHDVAEPLGLALELAAFGVSEIVDENMANAARVHAVESGKDARGRTLIAFGGAAPLHAARLAEKLGIDRVLVPSNAGVGSAVGFLRAPIAFEIVRSRLQRLDAFRCRRRQRPVRGDAGRGRGDRAARRRRRRSPRPARPSCATAARATRSPCRCRPASIATMMRRCCARRSRRPIAGSTAARSPASRSRR